MTPEHGPTADVVADVVRSALGENTIPPVRPIGEGGEHSSWRIGTRHVARFALDRDASARQRREIALRDLVRPHVGIPLPRSVAVGEWAPGRTFTVDAAIPGASGEDQSVSTAGEADLARLLAGLRSVPVHAAAAVGVPAAEPPDVAALSRRAGTAADWLAAHGRFDVGLLPRLVPPALAANGPAARVLVHNDLKGEHLRVTGDGRVCGVLDWTDAELGDPAADVAGLAISVGAAAAVRVASAAGYDSAVCVRGVHLARCGTVLLLADRLQGRDDSPLALLRTQLERAWEVRGADARALGAGG
ncbi:phosphotransferase family protein [Marinactinospora rubrisoli]|uniref:Phosphotransferase family protein n=1 Tax=Marinactinospora rubrisoli TaxID=2715399 RepID=A0ABW2KFQ1_9ACTN